MTDKKDLRGRKKIDDKKIVVYVLPRQSEIDILGGKEEVKKLCEAYIADCAFQKMILNKSLNQEKNGKE